MKKHGSLRYMVLFPLCFSMCLPVEAGVAQNLRVVWIDDPATQAVVAWDTDAPEEAMHLLYDTESHPAQQSFNF